MKHSRAFDTVLVTGGAGFIGSHFIRRFLREHPSAKVVNLDALTYAGNLDNLSDIASSEPQSRYVFVQGDISDRKLVLSTLKKHRVDAIINFAGETHVDNSIFSAQAFIETNIDGVFALMVAARDFGIRRFVHISTDEVYGDIKKGTTDEESSFRPSSPYSASKAAADLLVQAYVRTHRFPAVTVRGSNNFGTHQFPEKLIPSAITRVLEDKPILLHGKGLQVRSWLHVEDFCSAIDAVLHRAEDGSAYNVAGMLANNKQIAGRIAKHFGKNPRTAIQHVVDRPGGDVRYAPDDAKLRRELGWKPSHTIESSLGDIIDWYQANPSWWKKIKRSSRFKEYERKWQGVVVPKYPS